MRDIVAIIGGILAILSTLSGIAVFFRKVIKRFEKIEKSNEYRKEENIMIIEATFAICSGLTQLGANGPVTEAKSKIEKYLIQRGE